MNRAASFFQHNAVSIALWMIVYYISGVISLKVDAIDAQISIVWFPAGVATAAFLCARWRLWPVLLLSFVIINVILDNAFDNNLTLSIIYAIVAMPASMLIAWITRYFSRPGDDLHIILLWLFATILVSFVDALLFSAGLNFFRNANFKEIFWSGFIADATGIIFATTVIMGFMNTRLRTRTSIVKNIIPGLMTWIILCLSSLLIFNNTAKAFAHNDLHLYSDALIFSLACIPVIFAVLMSLLWGNRGGSLALLTLSAIAMYFTKNKLGPFFMRGLYPHEPLMLIQGYLTATTLLMVFIRVITRDISHLDAANGIQARQYAVYQLNLATGEIAWGNLMGELGLIDEDVFSHRETLMQRVHPDDRDLLAAHWAGTSNQNNLPIIQFRLSTDEGAWIRVTDSGSLFFSQNTPQMIVGKWRITKTLPLFKTDQMDK